MRFDPSAFRPRFGVDGLWQIGWTRLHVGRTLRYVYSPSTCYTSVFPLILLLQQLWLRHTLTPDNAFPPNQQLEVLRL